MELNKKTKDIMNKNLLDELGVSLEEAQKMGWEEFESLIELKSGKKLSYAKPSILHQNSGDDSVLIDNGRFTTMEEVDEKMDRMLKKERGLDR